MGDLKLFCANCKYNEYARYVFADNREEAIELLVKEDTNVFEMEGEEMVAVWRDHMFNDPTTETVSVFEMEIEKGVL